MGSFCHSLSPRTYLGSTHSPCQLWKLQRGPQPGVGDPIPLILGAMKRNHDRRTHFQDTSNPPFGQASSPQQALLGIQLFISLLILRGDLASLQLQKHRQEGRWMLLLFCVLSNKVNESTRNRELWGVEGRNEWALAEKLQLGHTQSPRDAGLCTRRAPRTTAGAGPPAANHPVGLGRPVCSSSSYSNKARWGGTEQAPSILSRPRGPGPPIAPAAGLVPLDSPGEDPPPRASRVPEPLRVPGPGSPRPRRPPGAPEGGDGRAGGGAAPARRPPRRPQRPLPAPQLSRLPRLNSSRPPSSSGPLQPRAGGGLRPLLQSPARPPGLGRGGSGAAPEPCRGPRAAGGGGAGPRPPRGGGSGRSRGGSARRYLHSARLDPASAPPPAAILEPERRARAAREAQSSPERRLRPEGDSRWGESAERIECPAQLAGLVCTE